MCPSSPQTENEPLTENMVIFFLPSISDQGSIEMAFQKLHQVNLKLSSEILWITLSPTKGLMVRAIPLSPIAAYCPQIRSQCNLLEITSSNIHLHARTFLCLLLP